MDTGKQPEDWPKLQVQAIHELNGPNLWSNHPALELWVDLGPLCETASTDVPGFNERLMEWLPTMVEHRCSVGERGGFFQRLLDGTYPAHILEHVSLELQTLAGTKVGYGRARAMNQDRLYRVVIRCDDPALGRAAVNEAISLIQAAYADTAFDVPAAVARIRKAARPASLDPTTCGLLTLARKRRIPAVQLGSEGLLILGHGKHQRRIHGTATDTTTAVAEETADDRLIHRPLLESLGIPMPQSERVRSATEAWAEAESLGRPIIVKPLYRDQGPGISPPLSDREQIEAAYEKAAEISSYVAVELPVPGDRFEVLMMDGRLVAAVQLADPVGKSFPVQDVTDRVHPLTVEQAADALRLVGLEVAIVAVIARDIERPLVEQGGVVQSIEVRADLSVYLSQFETVERPVLETLLDRVFPPGSTGRIPLVAVAGGPERQHVSSLIEQLLCKFYPAGVGHAAQRLRIQGKPLYGKFASPFEATRALLLNPYLEAAVVEVGRLDVLLHGLGFDCCRVGLVTGLDEYAELPRADWGFPEPEENLPRAERSVVETIEEGGMSILWVADPRVESMIEKARGEVMVVAPHVEHPALISHLLTGGRGAHLEPGTGPEPIPFTIVLSQGQTVVGRVPCVAGDAARTQVQEPRAGLKPYEAQCLAVAALWALGHSPEAIAQALK